MMYGTPYYQLAFLTPGMSPSSARLRKQIRQIPNFRYTARGRPQSRHRCSDRVEYLGFRIALAIFDLLAIDVFLKLTRRYFRPPNFSPKHHRVILRANEYVCYRGR